MGVERGEVTSHTTHTHLPFLPPSVVFLMVHDNLYVYLDFCICVFVCVHSVILKVV